VSSHDDKFPPYWREEKEWLVNVVMLPAFDPDGLVQALDSIGNFLAFSMATETRMLALVIDPDVPTYELWFSFSSQKQREEFLQMVLDDGYADPDEEYCFNPPNNLEDLKNLRPISEVFPKDQIDYIMALALMTLKSMESSHGFQASS
jgi:hypothetical protein